MHENEDVAGGASRPMADPVSGMADKDVELEGGGGGRNPPNRPPPEDKPAPYA